MIEFVWDSAFKKSYKKNISKSPQLKSAFRESLKAFQKDPFAPQLKTHKLSGKLSDLWAFSINYKVRVIFYFINNNKVLLIDIGTHDEVY